MTLDNASRRNRALNAGLWTAQLFLGGMFIWIGLTKLLSPISQLAQMLPWAGQLPIWFVRSIAIIDLAGGVGVILPALVRIYPKLTVWAARGCAALQICAMVFHVSRGEASLIPLNGIFLMLSLFILWGRSSKIIIQPRT